MYVLFMYEVALLVHIFQVKFSKQKKIYKNLAVYVVGMFFF